MTKAIIILLAALFFVGCAHDKVETNLDKKVAQEPELKGPQDLENETTALIANSKTLTPEQREKLLALQKDTRAQVSALREEALKLKSVLLKDLTSANYNDAEVEATKKRIRRVENKRLGVLFTAIDKVNKIIGRPSSEHEEYMRNFFKINDEMQ